ncbi:MAG: hypothetical protein EXR86_06150 [Gammaproteobacteria bacterium]|nr:hypothetical protein [Gammaproteobacteria bacterium]
MITPRLITRDPDPGLHSAMSWYPPYVPVAERRRKAAAAAERIANKQGRALAPVILATKKIATTFWGKAWCDNLEAYSDYANRLPRGRSYVHGGSVIDLQITTGKVEALVQGSELYEIAITFKVLAPKRWKKFKQDSAGKVVNLLDLLQGKLSTEILTEISARDSGLFPTPTEIGMNCSCPDWAEMCKHVAAVLYGVGARLDVRPELFFTLRGVDVAALISAASDTAIVPAAETPVGFEDAALSELFGVEIESPAAVAVSARMPTLKKAAVKKVVSKTTPVAAAKVKSAIKPKPKPKLPTKSKDKRKPNLSQ